MKNKIWIFTVLCSMIMSLFCGCKGGTSDSSSEKTEQPLAMVSYLIKDGESDYMIVYPSGEETAQFAATELQSYIEKATGVIIPVTSDFGLNYSENGEFISLGKTSLLSGANLGFDYSTLAADGFFVKTVGTNVFIDGPSDRSVIYGVYDLLEEEVGVRFVTPDYDYIPKTNEIKVMTWDRAESPMFNGRSYYSVSTAARTDYCVKMRMSHGMIDIEDEKGGNFGWANTIMANHNSIIYVNPSEYSVEEYPEFYAVKNGVVTDICWTYGITEDGKLDPEIEISPIRVAIESLKRYVINSDKNSKYFMFAQMDGADYCQCGRCLKDSSKYKRSGIAIRFANILAEEIQKWADAELNGREVNVVTFAYAYTTDAPVDYVDGQYVPIDKTVKPRENVIIRLARLGPSIYYAYNDEKQGSGVREFFDQWAAVHDRFFIWTYHADWSNSFDLAPNIHMWSQQLHYLKDMGIEDVFMQSEYYGVDGYKAYLETYIASRMLWNIDIDVNAAVQEFNRLYFGEAAAEFADEYVTRHVACVHIGVANGTLAYGGVSANSTATSSVNFSLPFVLKQLELMDAAIEATYANNSLTDEEKEMYRKRLIELRLYAKYLQLDNYVEYYGVTEGRYELACSFQEDCVLIGETAFSEYKSITAYLEQYGL